MWCVGAGGGGGGHGAAAPLVRSQGCCAALVRGCGRVHGAPDRPAALPLCTLPTPRVAQVAQKRVQKKHQVVLTRDVEGLGAEGQLKSVPVGYYRNYLQPQGLAAFADDRILETIRRQREEEERQRLEEKAKAQAMVRAAGAPLAGAACWNGLLGRLLGRPAAGAAARFRSCGSDRGSAACSRLAAPAALRGQQAAHRSSALERRANAPRMLLPRPLQATALATIGKFVIKKKVGEKEAIFGSVTAAEIVDAIRMQVGARLGVQSRL